MSLSEVINGWERHLARLMEESTRATDRDTWGAHDYFAALHLRDYAESGVRRGGEIERLARDRLVPIDANFITFTEEDERGLVRRFADEPENGFWWWGRIPLAGLARTELDQWGAGVSG